MGLKRRDVLRSMALLGAASAFGGARAEDGDSIFGVFERNRILRDTDRDGNTAAAMQAIDTIEPVLSYDTAYNLQTAIALYERIVAAGGWEQMPREVFGLVLGNDRNGVIALKNRLMMSGDLAPATRVNGMFDEELDAAVRRFQARHGIVISGKIDEPTFFAINATADYRLNQLRLNAQRVDQLAGKFSDRYVVVNIPAATIEAVEAGTVAQRHTAVVGRIDRQTPILSSRIHQINFNPYWHVPKSIIQRDLIKYMNDDPEYLTKYRIHIYDGNGQELMPTQIDWTTDEAVQYTFRQEPGGENSMGHVKINFHNPHSVYLHDTPSKALFAENARFHSSGCVRVEGVNSLVAWILQENGGWDVPIVDALFATNERMDVAVNSPVPIHTTYISAWANRLGTVSFRDDVYQFDAESRVTFA